MKTYMPLNGLWWSRDSGSANCDMPQSAVLGRPGGGFILLQVLRLPDNDLRYRNLKHLMPGSK